AGTYWYGSIPVACTRPSHTYRYRSSLLRDGAEAQARPAAVPPSRISTTAARTGTLRSSHTAPAKTTQDAPSSPIVYQAMFGDGRRCTRAPSMAVIAATARPTTVIHSADCHGRTDRAGSADSAAAC